MYEIPYILLYEGEIFIIFETFKNSDPKKRKMSTIAAR
jgi:hypothetical protein